MTQQEAMRLRKTGKLLIIECEPLDEQGQRWHNTYHVIDLFHPAEVRAHEVAIKDDAKETYQRRVIGSVMFYNRQYFVRTDSGRISKLEEWIQ